MSVSEKEEEREPQARKRSRLLELVIPSGGNVRISTTFLKVLV